MTCFVSNIMRGAALTSMALTIAACATVDTATRSAPLEVPGFQEVVPSFAVTELRVAVPEDLSVSEANVFYPLADIVWRGDPIGNRHDQVLALVTPALQRGVDRLEGVQPVEVDVAVTRFHSLTEKARYTVGGVHSIRLDITVRDAVTGAVLIPTRRVNADLDALGGRAAIEADRKGNSQKMRIADHLAYFIEQELQRPLVSGQAI